MGSGTPKQVQKDFMLLLELAEAEKEQIREHYSEYARLAKLDDEGQIGAKTNQRYHDLIDDFGDYRWLVARIAKQL